MERLRPLSLSTMIGTIATAATTGAAIFSEVSSVETIIAIVTRTGMAVAATEMIVGTIISVEIDTIVVVAAVTTDIADGAITTAGKARRLTWGGLTRPGVAPALRLKVEKIRYFKEKATSKRN